MGRFNGKGAVVVGLVAAALLSKKENRDKAVKFVNSFKDRTNSFFEMQRTSENTSHANEQNNTETLKEMAETYADVSDYTIDANEFIGEGGAQQTLNYYNEQQHKGEV
ncbi:hypothetical protein [Lysinibacillus sp. 54212]|uniref:hypothetical protein n=1 Tax=Lysinibacillus sp. 54212 TaxID=3119829 RepID=UPI002FC6AAFD